MDDHEIDILKTSALFLGQFRAFVPDSDSGSGTISALPCLKTFETIYPEL